MKRVVVPELLDTDSGTEYEISTSLADLRRINRWFGGVSTTRSMINHVARRSGQHQLSLLEVAAGSGAVPIAAAHQLRKQGVHIDVTLLDRSFSHLNGFRPSVVGNALTLPFCDGGFDLVSCVLFAHHLEPEELRSFVFEALRVCRVAVLINDLRRSTAHLMLIYAGLPLFRSPMTRHDAIASVKRSYTSEEFRSMFAEWGLHGAEMANTYLCRTAIVIWKEPVQFKAVRR